MSMANVCPVQTTHLVAQNRSVSRANAKRLCAVNPSFVPMEKYATVDAVKLAKTMRLAPVEPSASRAAAKKAAEMIRGAKADRSATHKPISALLASSPATALMEKYVSIRSAKPAHQTRIVEPIFSV